MTNIYDKKTIDNLYALATSPKLEIKLHHRYCPMNLFVTDEEGNEQEVVLPIVVGTAREIKQAEVNAENTTRAELGDVPLKNRGFRFEGKERIESNWDRIYNYNRSAEILAVCVRLPGQLDKLFFDNVEQVQAYYPPDKIRLVMDHYYTVKFTQPHYTLLDSDLDPEDRFQDVIDKIVKQGSESDFFLNSLTTHAVNQLVKYLVKSLTSLQNTNGGSTTPSNSSMQTEQSLDIGMKE